MVTSGLSLLRVLALCAALALALIFGGVVLEPAPVRTQNAAGAFDAVAAAERLARVLGDETPHPVDSAAEEPVRERLLVEIRALGFEPEVRDQFSCRSENDTPLITCGRVRNIVFSIGPASGPAILAASHYDSVPAGPGAGDDGIGVATWLEIARVIAHEHLTRRVIFLISDGEELGLLGAEAFAKSDPLMSSVQALVNLEARGTRGPAIFFETNTPNADAIRAYAGAERPLANSIMADVYRLLPNSTDVTTLRRENLDIVNIALLDGFANYHTPNDNLANFDRRSLQHMGDTALSTLRAFASAPDGGATESLVFTDVATHGFISMPQAWGPWALGLCVLIAAFSFWRTGKEGRWRALALPPLILIDAGVLAFVVGFGLNALRGAAYWSAFPLWTQTWCMLIGLLSAVIAIVGIARDVRGRMLQASGTFWLALVGFAGSCALPGLSILFVPVVAIAVVTGLISLRWSIVAPLGGVAAGLVMLVLWAPTLSLVHVALGFQLPFANAGLAAIVLWTWLGALAWAGPRWSAVAALGAGVLASAAVAAAVPTATPAVPRALNIVYMQDAEQGARFIAGSALAPLPPELARVAHFEAQPVFPGDERLSWIAPAPFANLPAPSFTITSVTETADARVVRAHLTTNGAYRSILRIPVEADPLGATINGVAADFIASKSDDDFAIIACSGRACDGAEIEVRLRKSASANPDWLFIGQYPGSPAVSQALVAAKPDWTIPIQFGDSATTFAPVHIAPPAG